MLWTEDAPPTLDAAKLASGLDDDPADRLVASHPRGLDLDVRAHRLQRANEADARLIDADILDHEAAGKRARNDTGDRQ